jgi:hypothetical protein
LNRTGNFKVEQNEGMNPIFGLTGMKYNSEMSLWKPVKKLMSDFISRIYLLKNNQYMHDKMTKKKCINAECEIKIKYASRYAIAFSQ